jgi:TolC family type I secretion outer membrane protein
LGSNAERPLAWCAIALATAVAATLILSRKPAGAADSLRSALAHAYETNPELQAERYNLRATDEQLPRAQAGWRPTIEASTSVGYKYEKDTSTDTVNSDQYGFKITLSQPVFRGFRTQNATAQARQVIKAGRQDLRLVEQGVLLQAVAGYMDVVRDRNIVRLRHIQIGILRNELRAAKGRFKLGEVTRTDVAQALTRYQSAIANHDNAKADLAVSVGEFIRYIGRSPKALRHPGLPSKLPRNLQQAIRIAERQSPEVLKARHKEQAARHFIDVRRGALLPRVSLQAEYGYNAAMQSSEAVTEEAVVRGVLTVPLYQAGTAYSNLREAKELANRRRVQILDVQRKVRVQATRVWSRFRQAANKIKTVTSQVGSAMLAVEGVRRETLLGSRTTQDTLDAERELMNARISLAHAKRDHIVRAYELLAAIGRLNSRGLGLRVAHYDPASHASEVDGKWFGNVSDAE